MPKTEKVTYKTLADAVKAVGGEANAVSILGRHSTQKAAHKARSKMISSILGNEEVRAKLAAMGITL